MGNCCSEDNTPFEGEIDVQESGLATMTAPLDNEGQPGASAEGGSSDMNPVSLAIPETPATPSGDDSSANSSATPETPADGAPSETPSATPNEPPPSDPGPPPSSNEESAAPPPASPMQDNSSTPFVAQNSEEHQTHSGLKPGAKAEEDLTNLPRAETRMTKPGGFALIYSQTAGGTLAAKWVQNGPPPGSIAFMRIEDEIDDLKLYNQPLQCGKNIRADWMNQAKALTVYLKQCWTFKGELELLPDFNLALPRRAVLVFHGVDLTMTKIPAPAAIDTSDGKYDACAIMPAVSETFKGQAQLKVNAFLEKAVRRGASVRF